MPSSEGLNVFVSVGGTATEQQEAFVRAVEDRLRAEGIEPHTVGRNTFDSDSPLKTVVRLMNACSGTVVIALERSFFPEGLDKRGGPKEAGLKEIKLPTCWNQIEAAMAYTHGHPLLVIVEDGLKAEGLLERGNDWYVQFLRTDVTSLTSREFNGVFAGWKEKVRTFKPSSGARAGVAAADLTISQLVGGMKASQLWSVLLALAALAAGAFTLGAKLSGR